MAGQLTVTAHYNDAVPLTLHEEKMMVEITAPSTENERTANLDLVVVLDTSASMEGEKLQYVKEAVEFVIRKMGRMDTLTLVPFSSEAGNQSSVLPLYMSDSAKSEASHFVQALTAQGDAGNIEAGLRTAARILRQCSDGTGRAAGVFLVSGGGQHTGDARGVDLGHFPVFTFGFGHEDDRDLLYHIASRSHGGTYHSTRRWAGRNRLLLYFAKVLGILRDVSVLELTVTLKPHAGATILRVDSDKPHANNRSSTIYFGELARKEHRKIIVDIQLPAVRHSRSDNTVMDVECSYRLPQRTQSTTRSFHIKIDRNRNAQPRDVHDTMFRHLKAELARREQADRIGKMRRLADVMNFGEAMNELAIARNALNRIRSMLNEVDKKLVVALSLELTQLGKLLVSHAVYNDQRGSAYVRAAILSHRHQRFAARGWREDVMLYAALPLMKVYSREAGRLIGI